ncbi:MAG: DUF5615 family PIN-like protein [Bryobacteraceae bacterium]
MKFKIDRNLPVEFADLLRQAGYEADTVEDEGLSGAEDAIVAECCRVERRILVSLDLDFANVRAYPPEDHAGLIVIRTKRQDKQVLLLLFRRVLMVLPKRSPAGQLWIVEADRIRHRPN